MCTRSQLKKKSWCSRRVADTAARGSAAAAAARGCTCDHTRQNQIGVFQHHPPLENTTLKSIHHPYLSHALVFLIVPKVYTRYAREPSIK